MMCILSHPVSVVSPGRPSAITVLQPHRTPSRKVSSNRYHGSPSPLQHKRPSLKPPMFSRPPGPPKAARLSRNSLLAGTDAVRKAIQQAAVHARMPDIEFEKRAAPNAIAPAALSLDGPLRREEYEMQDMNFERWIPATYTWRLDEASFFREILNNSGTARARRMAFWLAPDPPLAAVLQEHVPTPSTLDATVSARGIAVDRNALTCSLTVTAAREQPEYFCRAGILAPRRKG